MVGKTLMFGANPKTQQALTIVGVTADFPTAQMSSTREQLLLPLAQHPGVNWDAVPVVDDGNGCHAPRGLGLTTLGERLDAIGGRLSVRPGNDGGTVVRAWVPHQTEVAS